MKPIGFVEALHLQSISFAACEVDEGNARDISIIVEDGAFVSMWRPSLRERARLAFGAPVRVLVNYSVHGPLHVDTERCWGTSSLGTG